MNNPFSLLLRTLGQNGRAILVASLVVGLLAGGLSELIKPHIDILIALLLFTACLRIGPVQALGAIRDLKAGLLFVIILQILLPLAVLAGTVLFDITNDLGFVLIMLMAAPPLAGAPHLVVLLGYEPVQALRQVVAGTAFLPLTTIPVFSLMSQFGDPLFVAASSFRLMLIIAGAAVTAFILRATLLKQPTKETIEQIDGASTLLLATTVIGLMAAIHNSLASSPAILAVTFVAAFAVNIGLQLVTASLLVKSPASAYTVPIGLISGTRNIALFLAALPAARVEPLLLFIGCYQIPMYLTPVIMRPFYRYLLQDQG